MKNKTKKILAGACLGLVGMGALTGCSINSEQQAAIDMAVSKADELIELVEKTSESLTKEDVNKLLELLTKMNENTTKQDIVDKMKEKVFNHMKLAVTQNLTVEYKVEDVVEYGVRIEYVSNELTKLYMYNTNEQGVVEKEIYREITPIEVTTYFRAKDFKMYSTIPMNVARSEYSLLAFNDDVDKVKKGESEYITWKSFIESYNSGKDFDERVSYSTFRTSEDEIECLLGDCNEIIPITLAELEQMGANFDYDKDNDIVKISVQGAEYDQEDGYDDDRYEYEENILTFTDYSYITNYITMSNKLGKPGVKIEFSEMSYVFDKVNENKINFDKTGYTLVFDYYDSLSQ